MEYSANSFALPALVRALPGIDNTAFGTGASIPFDAQAAMLSMQATQFRHIANEILNNHGHDYNDLALISDVIDEWLESNDGAPFVTTVDEGDFRDWLADVGVSPDEALRITGYRIEEVRDRVENQASPSISR